VFYNTVQYISVSPISIDCGAELVKKGFSEKKKSSLRVLRKQVFWWW